VSKNGELAQSGIEFSTLTDIVVSILDHYQGCSEISDFTPDALCGFSVETGENGPV
jgi:hypothetical protein